MKILVVDDSDAIRKLLESLLRAWDYEVVLATNGALAWDAFQREPVSLVLADWMMPELSGIDLVRKIRSMNLPGYAYVIILTGRNEKEDLVEAMDAGADDFVGKPIHPGELRVRVRHGERIVLLERQLAEQNRQLRNTQAALVQTEKLASLGQLAAGMAHEINNPIAFVANNLAVLKRDVTAAMAVLDTYRSARDQLGRSDPELAVRAEVEEARCDLEWIRENLPELFDTSLAGLARVCKIVGNLRDFARLDEAASDEIDANAALQSTADVLQHDLTEKRLTLTTHFDTIGPVLCQPGKIHQLFHNLLLNAIQASAEGGTIELRTISNDAEIIVDVEDHGCGIDAGNLPRIFEPFFTTKPVGSGAGLGLAACYGIVRDHGGTITVESAVGRGSLFRVRLPSKPAPTQGQPAVT